MKPCLLFAILFVNIQIAFGQDDSPKQVTVQQRQKIKSDIEKQIPAIKQALAKKELTGDQIEFAIDTFRIEALSQKVMEIDYSTAGMVTATGELADGYDKIMNKYYNKLLKTLSPEDKKILIAAQKAWLAYRDAEAKLIGTMTKETYSGGGTIQSILATDTYSQMIVSRTLEIFNFYDGIIKDK
jgi:uncharacterized protein YecT (DUF1311 family)